MDDPFRPDVQARIRQAFLLGLARQPLTTPPSLTALIGHATSEPALALLALAGQRQRFASPQPGAAEVPELARRMHQDPRPILPPQARRALMRLAGSVPAAHAASVMQCAARRIGRAGCRIHPFDLPELARHIKSDAENLGPAERAHLALTGADAEDDGGQVMFYDQITVENWATFPKAQRRAFVAELRRTDPAAGRALIESVWKAEPAPVRAALLEALATGLGPDDMPFLQGLATDRADTVKATAARLVARLPSTEAFEKRLAAAAGCFRKTGTGLGRVMAAMGVASAGGLTFQLPGDPKNLAELHTAREQLFSGLTIRALAAAVGDEPEALVAALPDDEFHIIVLLLDTALADGDVASANRIAAIWLLSRQTPAAQRLATLAERLRTPLESGEARDLITSPAWAATIRAFEEAQTPAAAKDDGQLVLAATLMPRETIPAFLDSLAALTPVSARAARDFAELVLALPEPGTNP